MLVAILYYTILYYTILYYTILYYTILYYTTIQYYTIIYTLGLLRSRKYVSRLGCDFPSSFDEGFTEPGLASVFHVFTRVHLFAYMSR